MRRRYNRSRGDLTRLPGGAKAKLVPTILVVDDERSITEFVSDALLDEGYAVEVVHDGASALLTIQRGPPDLVLLDVGMPVMTGDELLRRLRGDSFSDLPVIIMTAGTNPEQYLDDGANAILKKPFSLDLLLDSVERNLAA